VTVMDNLSTGKWSNVDHLEHAPNLTIIITSASDRDLLKKRALNDRFPQHITCQFFSHDPQRSIRSRKQRFFSALLERIAKPPLEMLGATSKQTERRNNC
jgi:hypothetical protein